MIPSSEQIVCTSANKIPPSSDYLNFKCLLLKSNLPLYGREAMENISHKVMPKDQTSEAYVKTLKHEIIYVKNKSTSNVMVDSWKNRHVYDFRLDQKIISLLRCMVKKIHLIKRFLICQILLNTRNYTINIGKNKGLKNGVFVHQSLEFRFSKIHRYTYI